MPGLSSSKYQFAEASQLVPKLIRQRLRSDKFERFSSWLEELQNRIFECRESMEREGVHYETVFTSEEAGEYFVYWMTYEVKAKTVDLVQSELPIDREHLAIWCECIDPTYTAEECIGHMV